jgi:hypothetical protein
MKEELPARLIQWLASRREFCIPPPDAGREYRIEATENKLPAAARPQDPEKEAPAARVVAA